MPLENTPPTLISAGTLDATFAGDGTRSVPVGSGEGMAQAIAVLSDNKYVVAGWSDSGGGDFDVSLLSFNSDGSLDTTFSGDGRQITALAGIDKANDLAVQADGKLIVVGESQNGSADFLIMRYTAAGELDTTFAGDGMRTQSLSAQDDKAHALALQSDGKIVVAGSSGFNYAITRYDGDGNPDLTFDTDGVFTGSFVNNTSVAAALALQADGGIVVAGYAWSGSSWDLAVARHTATGALDTSFSGDGKLLINLDNSSALEAINAIAIQSDGKILLACNTPGSGGDLQDGVLIRLNADGTFDTGFGGGDGIVTLNTSARDDFNSIEIQADGKIIAAGNDQTGFGNALIARYNADGSLDTAFANGGVFTTLFGSGTSEIYDLAFAANGQIVAVGSSYTGAYDFGILRLASAIVDQTARAGEAFNYVVPAQAFHDADGDALTYAASLADGGPLPSWLAFDAATGAFSGTPTAADFGTLQLAVQGGDGVASVAATVQLEVSTDFIEALRSPDHQRWNDAVANGTPGSVLTFSFMDAGPSYASVSETGTFVAMNATQESAVRDVLRLYQEIAGLTFVEVADGGEGGQLRFGNYLNGDGYSGYAYYPSPNQAGGDVWINRAEVDYASPAAGNAAYWVLLHEIGHALGFKHPGLYHGDAEPYLAAAVDTNQYTVMSYNNHDEGASTGHFVSSPMLFDVAAIQFLYGANTATRAGDDRYSFDPAAPSYETLWDGGGVDTLDASGFSEDCEIDLRAGEFSSLRGIVPAYEWVGPLGNDNIAIAYGCIIENAVGGNGADLLIGNASDNILTGGLGNDTYLVQNPGDRIVEAGTQSSGIDNVQAAISWTLGANLENLELLGTRKLSGRGNGLDNILTGNDADNVLDGGAGADVLIGGAGNDIYVVNHAGDAVQETQAGAAEIDSVRAWANWTLGDNLENLTLLGVKPLHGSGNGLNNNLTGNGNANSLDGGAGNDTLNGASGNDTLTGGAGSDTFAFATPLNAARNVDTIADFSSGSDRIQLSPAIFRQIGFSGEPSTDAYFHADSTAHDADDRILYDSANGALYYDADGSGTLAAIQFAQLSSAPLLLFTDIFIA